MHYKPSSRGIVYLIIGIVAFLGIGTLLIQGTSGQEGEKQDTKKTTTSVSSEHSGHTMPDPNDPNMAAVNNLAKVESTLETDKKEFAFGNIPIYGGKVSTTFTITNSGNEPLTLTRLTTSCMCTEAIVDGRSFGLHMSPWANITLQPGGSKQMTVTFDPLAHGDNATGPITRLIAIETNSSKIPMYELKITGNVTKP